MKELQFTFGESRIALGLEGKVAKEDLYGDVIHLVEREGRKLEKGWLLPDGRLLRRAQISSVATDPEGTPIEPLTVSTDEGLAATLHESSFDTERTLRAVPLSRLAGFNTADAYALTHDSALAPGLYETVFNYRKSYQPREALVLVKPNQEAWLLTGTYKRTTFVGRTLAYEFFDAAPDETDGAEGDPLDFSMM
jgi:hypothetical protein